MFLLGLILYYLEDKDIRQNNKIGVIQILTNKYKFIYYIDND